MNVENTVIVHDHLVRAAEAMRKGEIEDFVLICKDKEGKFSMGIVANRDTLIEMIDLVAAHFSVRALDMSAALAAAILSYEDGKDDPPIH